MSGGSHNYLYSRAPDEIGEAIAGIEGMGQALRARFPFAAWQTDNVARLLREAKAQAEKLADLWHAQEWLQSGDWGRDAVRREAVKLGEQLSPCGHSEIRGWVRPLKGGGYERGRSCEECGEEMGPE